MLAWVKVWGRLEAQGLVSALTLALAPAQVLQVEPVRQELALRA